MLTRLEGARPPGQLKASEGLDDMPPQRSRTGRQLAIVLVTWTITMALCCSLASAAQTPTLGQKHGLFERGFGRVRPSTIFLGGDPTGLVEHIRWTAWGNRLARGVGTADFVWPGQSVAGGSVRSPAKIVAYDLRTCRGHRAYLKVTWYFPQYGGSFEPSVYQNTCNSSYPPYKYTPPAECGATVLHSPEGYAEQVSARGIACPAALELVANSPAASYLFTGGRFVYGNLYCGTEGYRPELSSPPVSFECARGKISISFELDL